MEKRTAVFPGSFDPLTKGHEDILLRALPLFDEIVVAIGNNSQKNYLFPVEKRKSFIENTFKGVSKIKTDTYNGLTIEFCKKVNAKFILRGLRNATDLDFEKQVAHLNKAMSHDIETVFLVTSPEHSSISSTIVREILKYGGDASQFLPAGVRI